MSALVCLDMHAPQNNLIKGKTMELVEREEKIIHGISTRTRNASEMDPATSKIAPLWQKFDKHVDVEYKKGYRVFGIYSDYESDMHGAFNVLAGTDQVNAKSSIALETKTIPAGSYLVFIAKGEMPKIAFEAWGQVWDYFSKDDQAYERAYTIDFEYYAHNEIQVHIAVKQPG